MQMPSRSTVKKIVQIYKLIRPHVRRTPVIEVDGADFGLAGSALF